MRTCAPPRPAGWGVFSLLLAALLCTGASADEVRETRVPIDAEDQIDVIDRDLASLLELFGEIEGFFEARLYQASDSTFVLEILRRSDGSVVKIRRPLSAEEVRELRETVTERITSREPQRVLDQTGRTRLLIGSLVLSLGYYGWAVPTVLDIDDARTAVGAYLITSGLGFFLPAVTTRRAQVTDGAATFAVYGASRGILYGMLLDEMITGEGADEDDDAEARRKIGIGLFTSVLGGLGGFSIASRSEMTPGAAEVLGTCGDFGLGWGAGAAYLAGFSEEDEGRSTAGCLLAGAGLGLAAGKWLSDRQPYTRGDAYVLETAGWLGTYLVLSGAHIAGVRDGDGTVTAAMTGSVAGLAAGHHLVRGEEFGTGQGVLVGLSTLAGGLVGLGIAYLAHSEDASDDAMVNLFLGLSSLGAAGGFWVMYDAYEGGGYGSQKAVSPRRPDPSAERNAAGFSSGRLGVLPGLHIPLLRLEFDF